MQRERKYTTVSIPVTLYRKIEKLIEGTGFKSVSEFVTYILREVIAMKELEKKYEPELSPEEIEAIKRKLKALGYI